MIMGMTFVTYSAYAQDTSDVNFRSSTNNANARALIDRVVSTNAGWDWIPRCGDGATWSTHSNYCRGGTGHDDSKNRRSEQSYGITNSRDLVNKVVTVNAGWDWKPRCAGGAHWSWSKNRCKGGTGHDHHDDDD
jgi:hypothetical protein